MKNKKPNRNITSKQAEQELMQIFNTAADGMRVVDKNFRTLRVNKTFLEMSKTSLEENLSKKCFDVFSGHLCKTPNCPIERILMGEKRCEVEVEKTACDGTKIPCIVTATPFYSAAGELIGIVEDLKNITDRKQAEEEIKKKNIKLEEVNITLKNVLAHIEEEKVTIKKNILHNVERNIKPLLDKVKKSKNSDRNTLTLLEKYLDNITSDFYRKLTTYKLKLTPTEVKICELIKMGLLAKEIAEKTNVAYATVTHHKKQIRKKLGLNNSPINLKTYLSEIDT